MSSAYKGKVEFHMGCSKEWGGVSTKDIIVPTSFNFSDPRSFKMGGETIGAVSFLQILAPELTDRMLADFF